MARVFYSRGVLNAIDEDEKVAPDSIAKTIFENNKIELSKIFVDKRKIIFLDDNQIAKVLEELWSPEGFENWVITSLSENVSRMLNIFKLISFDKRSLIQVEFLCDMNSHVFEEIPQKSIEEIISSFGEEHLGIIIQKVNHSKFIERFLPTILKHKMNIAFDSHLMDYFDQILMRADNLSDTLWLFDKGFISDAKKAVHELLECGCEYIEEVLSINKDIIESKGVFVEGLIFYQHIIDLNKFNNVSIASGDKITKQQLQFLSPKLAYEYLKNPEISEEVFNYLLALKSDLGLFVNITCQSAERQKTFMLRFQDYRQRYNYVIHCDKLDEAFLKSLFSLWMQSDMTTFKCSKEQAQVVLKDIDITTLDQEVLFKIVNGVSGLGELSELMKKYMAQLNDVQKNRLLSQAIYSDSFKNLILSEMLSEEDFLKLAENLSSDYTGAKLIFQTKYYHLCTDKQKTMIAYRMTSQQEEFEKNIPRFLDLMTHYPMSISNLNTDSLNILIENKFKFTPEMVGELNFEESIFEYMVKSLPQNHVRSLILEGVKNITEAKYNAIKDILLDIIENPKEGDSVSEALYKKMLLFKETREAIYNQVVKGPMSGLDLDLIDVTLFGKDRYLLYVKSLEDYQQIEKDSQRFVISGLKENLVSYQELVDIIDEEHVMKILWNFTKNHEQENKNLIRLVRMADKAHLLPDEDLSLFEFLDSEYQWDFYNNDMASDSVKIMTKKQRRIFQKNLTKAVAEDDIEIVNPYILTEFEFTSQELLKIIPKADAKSMKKILDDTFIEKKGVNRERVESILKENQNFLKVLVTESYIETLLISLYQMGFNKIFSYEYKDLDLNDSEMIEFLNASKDSFLLEKYKKDWKTLSPYRKYSPEISAILAQSVKSSEIKLENITFESNKVVFQLKDTEIPLVVGSYDKKGGKWVFIEGYRQDLFDKVTEFYEKYNEMNPLKIYGKVNIESGEFEYSKEKYPKTSITFNLDSEDGERITVMKELGASGFISAVAKRTKHFNYKIEVLYEKEVANEKLKSIEKTISQKTFDINKKLQQLLKINSDRTFGFELELLVRYNDRDDVAEKLRKKGHNIKIFRSYQSSAGGQWEFKEDGSLYGGNDRDDYDDDLEEYGESGDDAFEIASPILKGSEGVKEAEKFLKNLFTHFETESGQDVNAGLHVHHDISSLRKFTDDEDEILKAYLPFQESLYSLVEDWRADSQYCIKIDPTQRIEGRNIRGGNHTGVVFTSYGTMEFRMKEGVTSSTEIINWIKYTQNIVDAIELKLKDDVKNKMKNIQKLSEITVYMLLKEQGIGSSKSRQKEKLKAIRSLVGYQESSYGA